MAKAPSGVLNLLNNTNKVSLLSYIKETQAEMKHVVWPKMSTAFAYTVILIVLCIIVAALLGFFDYIFSLGIQKILIR